MTQDQINAVLERVHSWPKARQQDAVRLLLAMEAQSAEIYELSPEERADIEKALDEIARGELATETEIEAVYARHRG